MQMQCPRWKRNTNWWILLRAARITALFVVGWFRGEEEGVERQGGVRSRKGDFDEEDMGKVNIGKSTGGAKEEVESTQDWWKEGKGTEKAFLGANEDCKKKEEQAHKCKGRGAPRKGGAEGSKRKGRSKSRQQKVAPIKLDLKGPDLMLQCD
jgi:hypothetical protein